MSIRTYVGPKNSSAQDTARRDVSDTWTELLWMGSSFEPLYYVWGNAGR